MAELVKSITEEFTLAEIQALAEEEGLPSAEDGEATLTDNGDGTHTYAVSHK